MHTARASFVDKDAEKMLYLVELDHPAFKWNPLDADCSIETRIADLEQEKLVLTEKLETGIGTGPRKPFDEMFELALGFLGNPCNLWTSGHPADR